MSFWKSLWKCMFSTSTGRTAAPRRHLEFEYLEERRVLSTFVVTRLADAGPGSLRQAIKRANNHAGLDHIRFHGGLTGKVIRLASDLPTITDAVTIQGPRPGKRSITIDGQDSSAAFAIDDTAAKVILKNLTVRNARSVDLGPGLRNDGPNTKLVNTLFQANEGVGGGAIANMGNLLIKRSVITGNRSFESGGALSIRPSATSISDPVR